MTTAKSLITDAFREGNIIPIGTDPTADELDEALRRLNRYIRGVYGYELGENLSDWPVPQPQRTGNVAANYPQLPYPANMDFMALGDPFATDLGLSIVAYPPKNSRIVWGRRTLTVYLPEQPDDGSRIGFVTGSGAGDSGVDGAMLTLDGNGRTIEGADSITLTDPADPAQWLYRADMGDWVKIQDLAIDDECPFPPEFDDLWIAMLLIRLAPRYSKVVSAETQTTAISTLKRLKARYRQSQVTTYGSQEFPRTFQSYFTGRWYA